MTKDEALKLALEALEATLGTLIAANEKGIITDTIWFSKYETLFDYISSEIAVFNEALAQPEQEPVKFLAYGSRFKISDTSIHGIPAELAGRWVALVAAEDDCHLKLTIPPQPDEFKCPLCYDDIANIKGKPLTDEQIWDAYMKAPIDIDCHVSDLHKFARAIEAAHGIKD